MKKLIILVIFLLVTNILKSYAIEVSTLKVEKKLEFSELFPKTTCDKIYNDSTFGKKNKLSEEVTLEHYVNLKRVNLNETNSNL